MVRKFNLINEYGQKFSLMDIENYCLLTEPTGLGYEYSTTYEQMGNTFITTLRKINQMNISATVNFKKYENYKNFVNFLQKAKDLKLEYIVPYEKEGEKTYYRDINLQSLSKGEKTSNGCISEQIVFESKSLWYEKVMTRYEMTNEENIVRWDFTFDSYWSDYSNRELEYVNMSHTDSPVLIKIKGEVINPVISLYLSNKLVQEITIQTIIAVGEMLEYSSRESDFYIKKIKSDGTEENLFRLDVVNFENDNVLRITPNEDAKITISADNNIEYAEVSIFNYFVSV